MIIATYILLALSFVLCIVTAVLMSNGKERRLGTQKVKVNKKTVTQPRLVTFGAKAGKNRIVRALGGMFTALIAAVIICLVFTVMTDYAVLTACALFIAIVMAAEVILSLLTYIFGAKSGVAMPFIGCAMLVVVSSAIFMSVANIYATAAYSEMLYAAPFFAACIILMNADIMFDTGIAWQRIALWVINIICVTVEFAILIVLFMAGRDIITASEVLGKLYLIVPVVLVIIVPPLMSVSSLFFDTMRTVSAKKDGKEAKHG